MAAASLAASAQRWVSGRGPFQEGEYLCLFAAYRSEIGHDQPANELLEVARPRFGVIQWLIWPYVWKWTAENFLKMNREARRRELERISRADRAGATMASFLGEEIEFWQRPTSPEPG